MKLNNKFAIGCLVQWYEIEIVGEYIESLKQALNHIDNTDDVKEPNKTNIDTEQLNIMDTNNNEEDLDVPTYLRNKRD